jgi:hypothetical protein
MSTLLRYTVALAIGAAAVPAFAVGHGNEGTDEVSSPAPYTFRIDMPAAAGPGDGHGNEGGNVDTSTAAYATPIEPSTAKAREMFAAQMQAVAQTGRGIDRSEDAGG